MTTNVSPHNPKSAIRNPKSEIFAELHCTTNFSFLRGGSHPDELVRRAAELGYAALAITDRNSLAGVVRAHGAAKDVGLKLLVGAQITPIDAPPVVLLATDRASYGRLARLITRGRRRAVKGRCRLTFDDVADHAEGLLAAVIPHRVAASRPASVAASLRQTAHPLAEREDHTDKTSCAPEKRGQAPLAGTARREPRTKGACPLFSYRELFGPRVSLLAELHRGHNDRRKLEWLLSLSRDTQIPLAAAGGVRYHVPRRRVLHDVLTASRLGRTVKQVRGRLAANAQRYLKPVERLAELFAAAPDALRHSVELARQCSFSLDQLRYEYPEELIPAATTPIDYLTQLVWEGAGRRYPEGLSDKARRLLEHELGLIRELRYEAYFLTVWDLVRFARSRDILCQGRGSAANSVVCYCLGITAIDPARMDLLFERFVSRQRNEAPDIDVDFEHQRREEVLQYIYEKYGRDRVGMTAEVITYRPRSAVRDVGKALGYSLDEVDRLAKSLEGRGGEDLEKRFRDAGFDTQSRRARQLLALTTELCGFPRHLSQHVGGMVMTQGPLCELVPIENAAMPGRTVIQWNKDDLDELGILKVDCLALGMLTAIRKCFQLVRQQTGRRLTLASVPPEDRRVYEMICRADTVGVFQIESRGQMSMLPRLRPRTFYDLVIEVAIVRPGPIQGNMVHPYLRRRMGIEPITYPSEAIRQVLEKTLGVPLFQEQAMRMAMVAAGFTPGEADQLRRAMGAWRRPGVIDQFRQRLLSGMRQRGISDEFAESVFRQIRGFGEYGFPESHAASFALLVYVSAWLKYYYPAAFTAALLNSQPMGFYAPAQLVRDAQDHQVEVRPVDVGASQWDCTLEGPGDRPALRLGLWMVRGLPRAAADAIVRAREGEAPTEPNLLVASGAARREPRPPRPALPFRSLDDFARQTGLGRATLTQLSRADAFGSLGLTRRQALWNAVAQESAPQDMPLFDRQSATDDRCEALPDLPEVEEVLADYHATGLSLRAHPISFYRDPLRKLRVVCNARLARLPIDRRVRVAGLVLLRQRPSTAKGITFVTLEDETGIANLVVHRGVWERYYQVARQATAMIVSGRLQRKHSVIHVVAFKLEDLRGQIATLSNRSRDFR